MRVRPNCYNRPDRAAGCQSNFLKRCFQVLTDEYLATAEEIPRRTPANPFFNLGNLPLSPAGIAPSFRQLRISAFAQARF